MNYLSLKLIHIISSTLLFGTGLGTAFFMLQAYRSKNIEAIAVVSRYVVMADWVFTMPAVIVQPLTGAMLVYTLGIPWTSLWLMWSIGLYIFIGMCWLPVVWLQIKMHKMVVESVNNELVLPGKFHYYFRIWFLLGWPAFISVLVIFYLMVFKGLP